MLRRPNQSNTYTSKSRSQALNRKVLLRAEDEDESFAAEKRDIMAEIEGLQHEDPQYRLTPSPSMNRVRSAAGMFANHWRLSLQHMSGCVPACTLGGVCDAFQLPRTPCSGATCVR